MPIKKNQEEACRKLSSLELNRIKRLLGRTPNPAEEAVISTLWSERCSYKSTKAHLSKLVSSGLRLPVGPGERGTFIELGDDLALILKLHAACKTQSSHGYESSHLIRELAAMGARAVAVATTNYGDGQNNSVVVGLLNKRNLSAARACGVKNRLLYVGLDLEEADPDVSARLMRACEICLKEQLVVGVSSIGIAGLALACFQMANRASTGLMLNLDEISKNYADRNAENILLSERPERMIMVADPREVPVIKETFRSLDLVCDDIGRVCGDGLIRISHKGHELINLPATLVMENAPRYRRQYHSVIPCPPGPSLVSQVKLTVEEALTSRPINFTDSVPAFVRLPESQKFMVLSWLTHAKLIKLHPFEGGRRAVCQGILEVCALGARAQGIGFTLNFGPPEDEARMTEFKHAMDGVAAAAFMFCAPIVSVHVNAAHEGIFPELSLAVIGLMERQAMRPQHHAQENHLLVMLGDLPTDYAGTEGLFRLGDPNHPLRSWELEGVVMLSEVAQEWALSGKAFYMGALSQGGLYQTLINLMAETGLGIRLEFGPEWLERELLLGLLSEDSPRILLSLPESDLPLLIELCAQKVPLYTLGKMCGEDLLIYHQGHLVYKARTLVREESKNPSGKN